MRNLHFKYAKAENFLCFDEEGIEINFESYGNIVTVKGKNLDVMEQDGEKASNGSGKSSIPEIIVYGLYGKTIKKPKQLTHLNLINNKADKKLVVEVRWDNYRVVRKRSASNQQTLQLWEENAEGEWIEISKGKGTQADIEAKIGLTYESFINIFIFSDDNTHPFLECDTTKKREIVENILSLEKYRNHSENAKELTKNLKTKIKDLAKEYEFLSEQKDGCISRISQVEKQELAWHEKMKKELEDLLEEIKKKRDELEQSSGGAALAAYQDAQEQIADLKSKIPVLEEQKTSFKNSLNDVDRLYKILLENIKTNKDKVSSLKKTKDELEKLISLNKKCISDIADKTSSKECPYCLGNIDEANFATIVEQARKVIDENEPFLDICKKEYEEELSKSESLNNAKIKTDKGIAQYNNKINSLGKEINDAHLAINELCKITPPDSNVSELLLAEQFENLKKKATEKQEVMKGPSPFDEIKTAAVNDLNKKVQDCKQKKDDIKSSEDLLPYYEFWVKAFGDTGIRKYVIDGIIPTLNDRIEYWLQFLIDNKIKLTFNSELEETIDRYPFNGRPYVYHGMSGGQRRRLNLTVAAAWAFVSALNSGSSPSVVFLDEVTMNVDAIGVHGIYRMICELAKEKQVFVIDHNEALLEMLSGSDSICLEMKDEVSKVVASF
jgi:DNA repair exonuclease SbcCD ATPase subunit